MTKKKSFLLAMLLLVFTLAFSCVAFTACEPEEPKENRAITWTYDADVVTVTAEGYETLPAELLDGTEVTFTVTVKDGYTLGTVGGAAKQDDGSYKLTVNKKDVTVKINASKTLNDIEVEVLKDVTYFEDNKVDVTSLKVTAKYVLGDEVVTDYTISYTNGNAFSEGDTSFTVNFGNKSQVITIKEVQSAQDFGDASLEVDADGNPVLVVTGQYNMGGDEEAAIAAVEDFFKECLERQTWAQKEYTAKATFTDDTHFTLKLTVKEWTASSAGNHYYFRYAKGGVVADGQNLECGVSNPTCIPSDSNDDLSLTEYTGEPLQGKDGASLYLGKCNDWGGCVMIVAVNEDAPKFNNVSLEVKDGKPYAVFNGTVNVVTSVEDLEASILKTINHLDMEDVSNGNAKLADYVNESAFVADETTGKAKAFFEINAEEGTFKLYCLLEGDAIQDGANFFAHLGAQGSDGYYPNVGLAGDTEKNSITCNGFTFTFTTAAAIGLTETWQANLLYINVTAA